MNTEDTRNLFLAIALSVLVMAAWQYFYAGPTYQREHQAQLQANNPVPKTETQPSVASGQTESAAVLPHGAPAAPPASREETVSQALTASPRVIIDTPSLGGSIDLKGGQLDDLVLKDYRETIDKKSPLIRLFSPSGAPNAYFAETGFVSGSGVKTPNRETVWTADVKTLTPDQPVTLTWDNGAGLVFKRVIAVDDKYMFTITRLGCEFERRDGDASAVWPSPASRHAPGRRLFGAARGLRRRDWRPGACADLRFNR